MEIDGKTVERSIDLEMGLGSEMPQSNEDIGPGNEDEQYQIQFRVN
eukprot:CAMPEP_0118676622 /NCGR_PEP_ID=MMETSP0800-20121206/2152_1 /TAXON_ID=210618 ORGANISM="Striatella unipunctata, Strain CCMP2910" /NCGR_SAMPLE_ID=MMETSP0800 /ASSEMBLY_ACC=CAM_ASM_000638 /LENGTH=45 /DNA_ID= /DNA_START= /DNA_END= /DNA_ORIENTATION=